MSLPKEMVLANFRVSLQKGMPISLDDIQSERPHQKLNQMQKNTTGSAVCDPRHNFCKLINEEVEASIYMDELIAILRA